MPSPYIQFKSIDEIDISFIQDELLKNSIEKFLDYMIRYQEELNSCDENIWEYIYLYTVAEGNLAMRIRYHLEILKKRLIINIIVNEEEKIIDVFEIAFIAVQEIVMYGIDGFRKMYNYILTKSSYINKRLNGDTSKELLDAFIKINTQMRRQYEKSHNEKMNHWFSKDFSFIVM